MAWNERPVWIGAWCALIAVAVPALAYLAGVAVTGTTDGGQLGAFGATAVVAIVVGLLFESFSQHRDIRWAVFAVIAAGVDVAMILAKSPLFPVAVLVCVSATSAILRRVWIASRAARTASGHPPQQIPTTSQDRTPNEVPHARFR